ncbi:outer membrane beta-barrel protein [Prolixibacter sp. NT017]|uniref:outer membrane beta-barrel protein n=1 Tax=Prolixibacter sp. NT017 TaxID=2652390 RepID=UPI00188F64FD|nr:outer membrane beta-barrel protein [Prolixibacter sp. NT017]
MKYISVLSLLLLFTVNASAQSENWSFALSMGGAWPVNAFKNNNPDNVKAGHAEKGFNMTLESNYALQDNLSLTGMLNFGNNPVNRDGVGTRLENMFKQNYDITAAERDYLKLNSNSWLWGSILVGPRYSINFNTFSWDFQALGGVNVNLVPNQQLTYDNPNNNWFYINHATNRNNLAFAWKAGTALRFAVSPRTNLQVGLSYFQSSAKISREEKEVDKGTGTNLTRAILSEESNHYTLSTLNATIGFVYYLDI